MDLTADRIEAAPAVHPGWHVRRSEPSLGLATGAAIGLLLGLALTIAAGSGGSAAPSVREPAAPLPAPAPGALVLGHGLDDIRRQALEGR